MAGLCSFFFHITLLTVLLQIIKYDYDRNRNHNLDTSHTDTITNHLTRPMLTSPFTSNHHQNSSSSFYESPLGARSFMRHKCNAKQSSKSRTFTCLFSHALATSTLRFFFFLLTAIIEKDQASNEMPPL